MHNCFIDESGAGERNSNNPHDVLVIAGVIVPEALFLQFTESVHELKVRFGLNRLDEIHACRLDNDIIGQAVAGFQESSWEDRRKLVELHWEGELAGLEFSSRKKVVKRHQRDHAYIHLSRDERLMLLDSACDVLSEAKATILISAVDRHLSPEPLYAFNRALVDMNIGFRKIRGKEAGTFIHDGCNYRPSAKTIVQLYQRMLDSKSGSEMTMSTLPFFSDSRWTAGIQMADLCAYSVRKYLSRRFEGEMEDRSRAVRLLERIEPLLLDPKHHSTDFECNCRFCTLPDHGDSEA